MGNPADHLESKLNDASTVALVVHGVGDHTPAEIMESASAGYLKISPESARLSYAEITEFPLPDGATGIQRSLQIEAGGHIHVVLPIVWSDLRQRASHATRPPIVRPLDIGGLIGQAFAPIICTWFDLLRCMGKAGSWGWRLALGAANIAFVIFSCVCFAGLIWLAATVFNWFGFHSRSEYHWHYGVLLVLGLLAVRQIVKYLAPAFDFVADVVAYVARSQRRREIESALFQIVVAVAKRAPDAKILLIGHSLGSVLTSHVALQLKEETRGRIILVTLGSPLRLMSRVFPLQIHSPDKIEKEFGRTGAVVFWANLWRDCDFIGRELIPSESTRFAEKSLGNGPHWNMWSDARLWEAVISVVRSTMTNDFSTIKAEWGNVAVPFEKIQPEVFPTIASLLFRRFLLAPLAIGIVAYFCYWGSAGRWFTNVDQRFSMWLWAFAGATVASAAASFFVSRWPADEPDMRYLGTLRRVKCISDLVFALAKYCWIGFFITLCWALFSE